MPDKDWTGASDAAKWIEQFRSVTQLRRRNMLQAEAWRLSNFLDQIRKSFRDDLTAAEDLITFGICAFIPPELRESMLPVLLNFAVAHDDQGMRDETYAENVRACLRRAADRVVASMYAEEAEERHPFGKNKYT